MFSLPRILGHTTLDMVRRYVNLDTGEVSQGGAGGGQPIRWSVILVPAAHLPVVEGPRVAIGAVGAMGAWPGGA